MFSPLIRTILIIISLAIAVTLYFAGENLEAVIFIAAALFLIYGYFRYGTVFAAFTQLKKGNFDKAKQLINKIKDPGKLQQSQRSYYFLCKGLIALEKENLESGYNEFIKALDLGLRTDNDTSMLTLNLAAIELERGNIQEAIKYLNMTGSLDHNPELAPHIKRLEDEINEAKLSDE